MTEQPEWLPTETLLRVLAGRFPALVVIAEADCADGRVIETTKFVGPSSRVIGMLTKALRDATEVDDG